MTNNEINIMYSEYGYDFIDQFGTLSEECGITYTKPIRVEVESTEACTFFNETIDPNISLSIPDCKCLEH